MIHIKDDWVEGEMFTASHLNDMANAINEATDRQASVIDDSEASDNTVYSSVKIDELLEGAGANIINDEQTSETSTCSSSKVMNLIEGAKFKTVSVDELPEEGEENTIYLTPAENNGIPAQECTPIFMYDDENNVVTIDTDLPLGEEFPHLSGISVGDIVRYTGPDTVSLRCMRTLWRGGSSMDSSTGETIFSGTYSVGDTFVAASAYNEDALITNYDNIAINWGSLDGITGGIYVSAGTVYEITDITQIPDESVNMSDDFTERYDAFVVTFAVAEAGTTATYEVESLGSLFLKRKPISKQYEVLTGIDKDEIKLSLSIDFDNNEEAIRFVDGVLSKLTLQEGRYYQLKSRYTLKAKNIIGNFAFMSSIFSSIGLEALVYEDITESVGGRPVDAEDVELVPGVIQNQPSIYSGRLNGGCYLANDENQYLAIWVYPFCDVPQRLKKGDVLKITGTGTFPFIPEDKNCLCITSASTDITAYLNELCLTLHGIISTREWNIGERYRVVDFKKLDVRELYSYFYKETKKDLGAAIMAYRTLEAKVPIFEKVSDNEEFTYEVNGLPGVILSTAGKVESKNKWIWRNGEWEFVSGPPKIENSPQSLLGQANNNSENLSFLG